MRRLNDLIDAAVDLLLVAVVLFPLATFGAVEEWAQAVTLLLVVTLVTLYVLRVTWFPPVHASRTRLPTWFGGRYVRTGFEWPALLLVAAVAVQLIPLPASWLATISPNTAAWYAQGLPGWSEGASSFEDLSTWLGKQADAATDEADRLTPGEVAELPPEVVDVDYDRARTVSIVPSYTADGLRLLLAWFAVFAIAFQRADSSRRCIDAIRLLVLAGAIASVVWILDRLSGGSAIGFRTGPHDTFAFGLFVSRNNFAGWLELVVPAGIGALALHWGRRRRARNPVTGSSMILLAFLIFLGLGTFLYTQSRGGVVSLAVASIVFGVVAWSRGRFDRTTAAVSVGVSAVVIAFALWIGGDDLLRRYETLGSAASEPSLRFRQEVTLRSLRIASDFPLLGTGLGTFEPAHDRYAPGTSSRRLVRAHNDYAQAAVELGLLGLIPLVWALARFVRRGLAPALAAGDGMAAGLAVGALALLIHELVDFNLQIPGNALLFAVTAAVLLRRNARAATARGAA